MKKRTKITLRTKIYLTIVGLLALTGVFYAANPSPFVTSGHGVFQPIGMAADKTNGGHLYVSQYEDNDIQVVDCNGNGTLFGTLPGTVHLWWKNTWLSLQRSPRQPGSLRATFSSH